MLRSFSVASSLGLVLALTACGDDTSSSGGGGSGGEGVTVGPTTTVTSSTKASSTSSTVTSGGPECGNGELEAGESCDGADLGDATCETQGFPGGTLGCTDACEFDTTLCETEAECGNDLVEGAEECDGTDLDDQTCVTLGFAGGTLACDACSFDTSGCTDCGNAAIDAGEDCDGAALGGETCVSLGYDSGTLACDASCVFDESGCDFVSCGNAQIDAGEDCDGAQLGGATCQTEGFTTGTLTCAVNCTFDTGACTTCGDDIAEGTEACDGTDLAGETCQSLGFSSGALGCSAACAFDTSGCSNTPAPGPGEIIITEIMQNPAGDDATVGEWFEVRNPSGSVTYQLGGCVVEGAMPTESFTIAGSLTIPPNGILTFSNVAAPGFTPSYVWSGFTLTNGADAVRIYCDGTLVDEVAYDGGTEFPDPDGASMSLSAGLDDVANDSGANWCTALVASPGYTGGNLGSPGETNPACPMGYSIDFCRLQFPTTIDDVEGTAVTVYGRLYIAGLTDQSTANNLAPNVIAAVGYGPDGSDPALGGWTWTSAVPNPGWDGAVAGEPNNDEYQASMTIPSSAGSPYDYAYRFSGDGGGNWTYCDGDNAGSSNGYAIADAGQMVSQSSGGNPTEILWCFQDTAGVFTTTVTNGMGTFSYGAGLTGTGSAGGGPNVTGCVSTSQAPTATGWNTATTFAGATVANDCYQFTVATADGPLTLYFDDDASGTGPVSWGVEARPDSGALFTTVVVDQATHQTFGPSPMNTVMLPASLANQAAAEIRICGYGASGSGGTWRVDNLRIESP